MGDRKAYRAKWYQDNKERILKVNRTWHYKNRYGITEEQYQAMLVAQNFVCAICKEPETAKEHRTDNVRKLAVDHCHTTKRVRGLLCKKCNHGIGLFSDNTMKLFNAIIYLEEFNEY